MTNKTKNEQAPQLSVLAPLLTKLPPIIARKKVELFLGGIVSRKTLANDDANSKGPRVRQYMNNEVFYPTEYLLEYLENKGIRTVHVQDY